MDQAQQAAANHPDGAPQAATAAENWKRSGWWPAGVFAGFVLIALLAWLGDGCRGAAASQAATLPDVLGIDRAVLRVVAPALVLLWVAALFAWFLHCFTGDPYDKRTRAITFAYYFMVLSFLVVGVMVVDIGKARHFGVVDGCIENLDPDSRVPIQCDYPIAATPDNVRRFARRGAEAGAAPAAAGATGGVGSGAGAVDDAGGAGSTGGVGGGGGMLDADGATGMRGADGMDGARGADPASAARRAARASDERGAAGEDGAARAAPVTFEDRLRIYALNSNYSYLLNIGGRPHDLPAPPRAPGTGDVAGAPAACPPSAIRGGLPVPVYFILLALMGGAISLARNVPDIQRRSDATFAPTAAEPRLTPGQTRELILFQVLQFVSAPIIAVLAYHAIKPASLSTTVALGFFAGFASDSIIASLRNLTRGAGEPARAQAPLAGSVHGVVRRNQAPLAGAAVELEGTDFRTATDHEGGFRLLGVPVSAQRYVLAVSGGAGADGAGPTRKPVSVAEPTSVDAGMIELA